MLDILRILEENPKATAAEIAAMVGRPEKEVDDTIRQAEKDRAIFGYRTLVNWQKLGEREADQRLAAKEEGRTHRVAESAMEGLELRLVRGGP